MRKILSWMITVQRSKIIFARRKHSSRRRTTFFCGSGRGKVGYAGGMYTLPPDTLLLDTYPPPYLTPVDTLCPQIPYLSDSIPSIQSQIPYPPPKKKDLRPEISYSPLPPRNMGQKYPTPPVNRLTDTCENIAFPQLRWWTVNMQPIYVYNQCVLHYRHRESTFNRYDQTMHGINFLGLVPVNPEAHRHRYRVSFPLHVPPFWQRVGVLEHFPESSKN